MWRTVTRTRLFELRGCMSRSETRPARRADARQNVEKILKAAIACLTKDPAASVSEVAQAAGVGRVTLYGHFPSREALVEGALTRVLEQGEAVLAGLDLDGDARDALRDLIDRSWLLIARSSAVLAAAQEVLTPDRVRELHAGHERRVRHLIERGQADGVFRDDLPSAWLTGVLHHLIKGAASDVAGGRLAASDAARFLAETVLSAYAPR